MVNEKPLAPTLARDGDREEPIDPELAETITDKMKKMSVYELYQIANSEDNTLIDKFIKQKLLASNSPSQSSMRQDDDASPSQSPSQLSRSSPSTSGARNHPAVAAISPMRENQFKMREYEAENIID